MFLMLTMDVEAQLTCHIHHYCILYNAHPSIRSMSSSLVTCSTSVSAASVRSSVTGSGSLYWLSASGLPQKFCDVQRRTCHELPPETTSTDAVHTDMKETVSHAGEIYLSDLSSQNSWPSSQKKGQMVQEAINQANAVMPTKGNLVIPSTQRILSEVNELISVAVWCWSLFRSGTKAHFCGWDSKQLSLKKLITGTFCHLWKSKRVWARRKFRLSWRLLSENFITRTVSSIVVRTPKYVYIYILYYGMPLTYKLQGNIAWFNHLAYLQILEEFAYGLNTIAKKFPHKFHLLYPIPSMALVADIVSTMISVPPKLTLVPVSCRI